MRIGVLAVDLDTRTRIRINRIARRTHDGISVVVVEEAFSNCPESANASGRSQRPGT